MAAIEPYCFPGASDLIHFEGAVAPGIVAAPPERLSDLGRPCDTQHHRGAAPRAGRQRGVDRARRASQRRGRHPVSTPDSRVHVHAIHLLGIHRTIPNPRADGAAIHNPSATRIQRFAPGGVGPIRSAESGSAPVSEYDISPCNLPSLETSEYTSYRVPDP